MSTAEDLHLSAYARVMTLPTVVDLLEYGMLRKGRAVLEEALADRRALRLLELPDAPEFRPDQLDAIDGQLQAIAALYDRALSRAEKPAPTEMPGLSDPEAVLRLFVEGGNAMEAFAAVAPPLTIAPLAQADAGNGRKQRWFVLTEVAVEPVRVRVGLLLLVTGAADEILGSHLFAGGEAEQQRLRLIRALGAPSPEQAEATARGLLDQLCNTARPTITQAMAGDLSSVRPRPGDAAKAFQQGADQVEAYVNGLFGEQVDLGLSADQTELVVHAAPSGALGEGHPLAAPFPGAYRKLAEGYLADGRVWLAWEVKRPGDARGVRFDGLVWLDDHFAWFPKPWRAFQD